MHFMGIEIDSSSLLTVSLVHVTNDPRCGYPMCSAQCARGETHAGAECRLMTRAGVRVTIRDMEEVGDMYSAVTVIR